MTCNPARILSKKTGTLKAGYPGNVTIIDPKKSITVNTAAFLSKSKNSPYDGWKLKGAAAATIVSGRIVMKDGGIHKGSAPKPALPKFININR
jgi:dihydroorotase